MATQEVITPTERYTIRGWQDGFGDPSVEIEIRPGSYNSLLPLADVAEAVRSQVALVVDIETVEVRYNTPGEPSEMVVPAP